MREELNMDVKWLTQVDHDTVEFTIHYVHLSFLTYLFDFSVLK